MRPENAPSESAPLRSLFMVDDEEVDRMLFARILRDGEIPNPVRQFATGEAIIDELIRVLRGAPAPLVCFLDVRMPGMNGFDVLRWIRCQRALADVAVVMLSSSEETDFLAEAQHFGAQCYLAKFPTTDQLRSIIAEAGNVAAAGEAVFKLPYNLLLGRPQALC